MLCHSWRTAISQRTGAVVPIIAYLLVGALYVESVPPWEAPDEPAHTTYAEVLAAGRLPTWRETYEAHQPPLYYLWPALAIRVLGIERVPRAPINPHYPFALYAYLHPPNDPGVPVLRIVRTFSGLLGTLVVALAWATARAARSRCGLLPVAAACVVGLLPQFVFIGHAVSNDTLAAALGGLVTYGIVRWASTPSRARSAAAVVGVALIPAVLTKVNTLAMIPAVVATGAILVGLDRSRLRSALTTAAALSLVLIATGALTRLVLPSTWSSIASNVLTRGGGIRWELAHPLLLAREMVYLLWSLWARFGWFSFTYPLGITILAALVGLSSLRGLSVYAREASPAERRSLLATAVIALALFLAAAKNLLVDPQSQGRLMFPALVAIGFLIAAGWLANTPPGHRGRLLVGLAAGLIAANIFATERLIPEKYVSAGVMPPPVDTRVVATPWLVAARLQGPHGRARQTFQPSGSGLSRIEVAVADISGEGSLRLRLMSEDGSRLGQQAFPLELLSAHTWVGVDVRPVVDSADQQYTLEILVTGGDGQVGLWGAGEDVYPRGSLTIEGVPGTDLMLLVFAAK